MTYYHRFLESNFVLNRGRIGIVLSKHGKICPWYWVDYGDGPDWVYDFGLEDVPNDWTGPVSAKFLMMLRGYGILNIWFRGFCFGHRQGWEGAKFAEKCRANNQNL